MLRLLLVAALIVGGVGGVLSRPDQPGGASSRLRSIPESALSRLPIIYASIRMFPEARPLFGWGYGNFGRYDHSEFQGRVADLVNSEKTTRITSI